MSVVTYNGVQLPYALSSTFNQEAIYDDVAHVDWCLTRFDIQVQCIISTDYLALLAPELIGQPNMTSPAQIMKEIRQRLLKPRKILSVKFGSTELIPQNVDYTQPQPVPPIPPPLYIGTVDARNGPQPQACSIVQMTNTTFLVSYHIVAHYWEGNAAGTVVSTGGFQSNIGNAVIYNRWTDSVDIDGAQFSRRVMEGKFGIRSDNNKSLIADDARRWMANVGVPPGFVRESSHYAVSADGLSISYRIIDKEVFKTPPYPAYEATGEYSETGPRLLAWRTCEVRVALRGANNRPTRKNTEQAMLFKLAKNICTTKLAINGAPVQGPQDPNFFVTVEAAMGKANMYENRVEYYMRVIVRGRTPLETEAETPTTRRNGLPGMGPIGIVRTPYSEGGPGGNVAPDPKTGYYFPPQIYAYGTAGILLRAAAYYDPSLQNTKLDPDQRQMAGQGMDVGAAGINQE